MTVSVIVIEPIKNDEKLAGFEQELGKVSHFHCFAENVYFASHDGSSRDLFDHLRSAVPEVTTELVVIEAKDVQDNSWRVNGRTFDWLNEALPDHPVPAPEFQKEVKW